jgi:hypothetical protein
MPQNRLRIMKLPKALRVYYGEAIEQAISLLEPAIACRLGGRLCARWTALRLLDADDGLMHTLGEYLART